MLTSWCGVVFQLLKKKVVLRSSIYSSFFFFPTRKAIENIIIILTNEIISKRVTCLNSLNTLVKKKNVNTIETN